MEPLDGFIPIKVKGNCNNVGLSAMMILPEAFTALIVNCFDIPIGIEPRSYVFCAEIVGFPINPFSTTLRSSKQFVSLMVIVS